MAEEKTVDWKKQMEGERALYLGELTDKDKVPGSSVTLGEAKEAFAEIDAEFQQQAFERATNVQKDVAKAESARQKEAGIESVSTTVVVPGVLANVETAAPTPIAVATATLPPLLSDKELKAMKSAELITYATDRGVEVKANVDTEDDIIAKLKGTYVQFADEAETEAKPKTPAK